MCGPPSPWIRDLDVAPALACGWEPSSGNSGACGFLGWHDWCPDLCEFLAGISDLLQRRHTTWSGVPRPKAPTSKPPWNLRFSK
uniref:Uncharacterized protein n=1 Tax=Zea mays TaxID=4577 RepID=B6T6A0_MAIZE|nr:hypothetical protein [Zea mays]